MAGMIDMRRILRTTELVSNDIFDISNGVPIAGETTLEDTTSGGMDADVEYWWLKILINAGVIEVYEYNFNAAVPSITEGENLIASISTDGNAFNTGKILLNIDKDTTGLWDKSGAADKLYVYYKYYNAEDADHILMSDVVMRDKAADTLISAPPVETDKGQCVALDDLKNGTVLIGMVRSDVAIGSVVELPFDFVVTQGGKA